MVTALRLLHRSVGLVLAVLVFAVGASGGLLLLRDPYYRWRYPAAREPITPAQQAARPDVLEAIHARWSVEGIRLVKFPQPGLNLFHVWLRDGSEAFVEPRTGDLLDHWQPRERLPALLFDLHAHLFGARTGTVINGIAGLIVVFMVSTGLVLWWPMRRRASTLADALPRRRSRGGLVRSHAAVGAVSLVPVLLSAGTGVVLVFHAAVAGVASRLLDTRPPAEPTASVAPRAAPHRPWTEILASVEGTLPDGPAVLLYQGTGGDARLMFRKRLPGEWHPNGRSYVLIDPYTARVVQSIDARTQGRGTRLMHAIYPVHAARVGGAALTLAAAAASASLAWLALSGLWAALARRRATAAVRAGRRAARLSPIEALRHE